MIKIYCDNCKKEILTDNYYEDGDEHFCLKCKGKRNCKRCGIKTVLNPNGFCSVECEVQNG